MKNLLKPFLMIAAFTLMMGFAGVNSAFADTVTFSTAGLFTDAPGGGTATFGTGTIPGVPGTGVTATSNGIVLTFVGS